MEYKTAQVEISKKQEFSDYGKKIRHIESKLVAKNPKACYRVAKAALECVNNGDVTFDKGALRMIVCSLEHLEECNLIKIL